MDHAANMYTSEELQTLLRHINSAPIMRRSLNFEGVKNAFRMTGDGPLPKWFYSRIRERCRRAVEENPAIGNAVKRDVRGRPLVRFHHAHLMDYAPGEAPPQTDWHVDSAGPADPRTLSVLVLLKEADAGGRFEYRDDKGRQVSMEMRAGDAVIFASKGLRHRVTPCISGRRQSLVAWAH